MVIRFLREFLGNGGADDRRRRSRSGLILSILMLPMLLGVMGCFELPAPIGDPEKSRIDPAMNGIWIAESGDFEGLVMIFEPYDKRTWLVRWVALEKGTNEEVELDVDEPEESEDAPESSEEPPKSGGAGQDDGDSVAIDEITMPTDDACTLPILDDFDWYPNEMALFKTWRTRIGGRSFLTLEFRVDIDSDQGITPRIWWGARTWLTADDQLALQFIDKEFVDVEEASNRRGLERVIRRNLDNEDLYFGDVPALLTRVPLECYDEIADIIDEARLATAYD